MAIRKNDLCAWCSDEFDDLQMDSTLSNGVKRWFHKVARGGWTPLLLVNDHLPCEFSWEDKRPPQLLLGAFFGFEEMPLPGIVFKC